MRVFKRFVQAYVRFVQKVLITLLLTLLYVFGFGSTYLFAAVFRRKLLRGSPTGQSVWQSAEGYECDLERCSEQS